MCNPPMPPKSSLVVFTHSHCFVRIKIAYVHFNDGCQYLFIVEEQGRKRFEINFVNFFLKITFKTLIIIFFFKQKTSVNMFIFYVVSSQHNLLAHNHFLKV
jgi:hypothetical protein